MRADRPGRHPVQCPVDRASGAGSCRTRGRSRTHDPARRAATSAGRPGRRSSEYAPSSTTRRIASSATLRAVCLMHPSVGCRVESFAGHESGAASPGIRGHVALARRRDLQEPVDPIAGADVDPTASSSTPTMSPAHRRRHRSTSEDLQDVVAERGRGPGVGDTARTRRSIVDRRVGPSHSRSSDVSLGAYVTRRWIGLRRHRAFMRRRIGLRQHDAADPREARPQRPCILRRVRRSPRLAPARPGVQPLVQRDDRHPVTVSPAWIVALHGAGTPPPWQQREMQVDASQRGTSRTSGGRSSP